MERGTKIVAPDGNVFNTEIGGKGLIDFGDNWIAKEVIEVEKGLCVAIDCLDHLEEMKNLIRESKFELHEDPSSHVIYIFFNPETMKAIHKLQYKTSGKELEEWQTLNFTTYGYRQVRGYLEYYTS